MQSRGGAARAASLSLALLIAGTAARAQGGPPEAPAAASEARPATPSESKASLPPVDPDATAVIPRGMPGDAAPTAAEAAPPPTMAPTPEVGAPAAAATPMPGLPAVAQRLKDALDARAAADAKHVATLELRKEHEAVQSFYAARAYAPAWSADGKASPAVDPVIARLQHAADDGLTVRGVPASLDAADEAALVAGDIALSDAVTSYARQASGSRVDPRAISTLIGDKPDVVDGAKALAAVSAAGADAGAVLAAYNPPQPGYVALRTKLAELRQARAPAVKAIPAGPALKVGMRDPRVPLIRARFNLNDDAPAAPEKLVYDTQVAAAVAGFQKAQGLPASGVLTARTIAALSGGQPARLEDEILANMERWRWMPRDLGQDRIEVNVPDFEVRVVRDGQEVTKHKVIVGKEDTPTPIFSNKMQFLIVNPYWNVPQSIVRKEMLPKLAQDPDYLRRMGYEVVTRHGETIVRQPPGERNALGRIKFMFPNDYAVYLHDTPSRGLFGATKRAFSHGCVRVDDPFGFGAAVMGRGDGWSEARIKSLMGGKERYVYLPKPLPVYIEYFTAYVDETGRLQLRDDVYGYDRKVKAALGLAG
jgi:murein L,D-transpeptidase YcbB/YkuD